MKFIIGYKQEMTQVYREDGTIVPVTVVKAEPCVVTQVKTTDRDGYQALQIGAGTRKRYTKTQAGHNKAIVTAGRKPVLDVCEVRVEALDAFKVGDLISVQTFAEGDTVQAIGTSKGKGFQGVVKRHGFKGQPATRGTKDQERMPGSIASKRQGAVRPGQRMAGRMGGDRITVKNLQIIKVDAANQLLYVKGALPGARRSMIMLSGDGDVQILSNMLSANQPAPVETSAPTPQAAETPTPQPQSEATA
ncbi:MAG: 50S ribosomal protein L3 [Parcubacteria group bacterium]|nr:50S ribosomal protein L3 [Parcubacteria group bacterium]